MIKWTDGWKYRLEESLVVELSDSFKTAPYINHEEFQLHEGVLTIYEGYLWDGASGPTLDTKDSMEPSAVHDCLYYACRQGLLDHTIWRDDIDREFHRLLLKNGMDQVRASVWYNSVRLFGNRYAVPQEERAIQQFPL